MSNPIRKALVGIAVAVFVAIGAGSPAKAIIQSDFVFMIDATGSMGSEIAGVRNGFSAFVAGLNAAAIDARFAIVIFGGEAELMLDFTSDQALTQTRLNQISITAPIAGIQNDHNTNPEAGLEAIRMVLGAAPNSELANNNIAEDGFLNFRAGARKNLILATDEDSDLPFFAANRFAGQGTIDAPPFTGEADTDWPAWQAEIDATAQAVIDNNAFLNMLINVGDSPSQFQYGDYNKDVSDPDFLNFDADLTLAALLADSDTDNSLQAQVLAAGLIARTFNINDANDTNFIDNFYAAKIEETVDNPIAVPEPATLAIFGLGLAGLGFVRRRREIWGHLHLNSRSNRFC